MPFPENTSLPFAWGYCILLSVRSTWQVQEEKASLQPKGGGSMSCPLLLVPSYLFMQHLLHLSTRPGLALDKPGRSGQSQPHLTVLFSVVSHSRDSSHMLEFSSPPIWSMCPLSAISALRPQVGKDRDLLAGPLPSHWAQNLQPGRVQATRIRGAGERVGDPGSQLWGGCWGF